MKALGIRPNWLKAFMSGPHVTGGIVKAGSKEKKRNTNRHLEKQCTILCPACKITHKHKDLDSTLCRDFTRLPTNILVSLHRQCVL